MFKREFKCFSVSNWKNGETVEKGGKIIMPPSVLEHLSRQTMESPMLFKISNRKANRVSHCGVLEFVAGERIVYIPQWMMRNLLLEEGNEVFIESVSLPIATFTCFQPQSSDFLDISNPKAVLENCLRNFACLTVGDIISIIYNNHTYGLKVLETKPVEAVSIIECDLQVDFLAPPGYVEKSCAAEPEAVLEEEGFTVFGCEGYRLDGKKRKKVELSVDNAKAKRRKYERGFPDYNYKIGLIAFKRNIIAKPFPPCSSSAPLPPRSPESLPNSSPVLHTSFPGTGQTLNDEPSDINT